MILRLDQEYDLVVTGVMDSRSRDSHLQFDFVASIALIEKEQWFGDWWNNMFYTYIQVNHPSDVAFLNSRFQPLWTSILPRTSRVSVIAFI